jgi:hypothetical protein
MRDDVIDAAAEPTEPTEPIAPTEPIEPALPIVVVRGVAKTYRYAGGEFVALRPTDLQIRPGEFVTCSAGRAAATRRCSTCSPGSTGRRTARSP